MAFSASPSARSYFIILAFSLLFLLPLLFGRFPAVGDMRDVYIPLESFYRQQQLSGHLPAWHPDIAWGFPVIASAQIGFFYPPSLLLRLLPLFIYLPLLLVLHLSLGTLGTYKFLSAQKVSSSAALLGALAFSLGGFFTLHLTHLNIYLAAAWLPWQLYFLHQLISDRRRPLYFSLAGFSLGLPFLVGQIQIPLLMLAFSLIWLAWSARLQLRPLILLRLLLLLLLIPLALGATQLLPTYELATLSSRSDSSSFDIARANQYSYPVYHLPANLFPFFFGNDDTYWGKRLQIEYGFYFGTLPFLLIVSSFILWLKSRPALSSPHRFWLVALVTSFLLALGDLSPFRLIGFEPSLWFFSAPARYLLFTSLAASYFIARAYDSFTVQPIPFYKLLRLLSKILLIVILIINLIILSPLPSHLLTNYAPRLSDFQLEKISSLLASAQSSSVSLASWRTWIVVFILLLLMFKCLPAKNFILITGLELALLGLVATPFIPWSSVLNAPGTLSALPDPVLAGHSRLLTTTDGGDTGAYFTDPETRADTVKRQLQRSALVPLIHSQYQVGGVAWPASLPLYDSAEALADIQSDLDSGSTESASNHNVGTIIDISQGEYLVTDLDYAPRYSFLPRDSDTEIPLTPQSISPTSLVFQTGFDQAGKLIVRDTWYPGWHALLNNREISINRHQNIFRALNLPPGRHQLHLIYQPKILYLGLIITLITAIFLLLTLSHSFTTNKYL